jgi:hypothetical protein
MHALCQEGVLPELSVHGVALPCLHLFIRVTAAGDGLLPREYCEVSSTAGSLLLTGGLDLDACVLLLLQQPTWQPLELIPFLLLLHLLLLLELSLPMPPSTHLPSPHTAKIFCLTC